MVVPLTIIFGHLETESSALCHALTIQYNNLLTFIAAGLYFCFKKLTDANIFIIMYGVTSIYFAVSVQYILRELV